MLLGAHVSISGSSVTLRDHYVGCSGADSTQIAIATPATIWLAIFAGYESVYIYCDKQT